MSVCNAGLAFSAVWVTSFANNPVVPYITVCTGIAFWLRIAKILSNIQGISDKLVIIGRNTYAIMMHHVAAFMLLKILFYGMSRYGLWCKDFDVNMFFNDVNYVYTAGGAECSKWLYLFVGIGVPLLFAKGQRMAVSQIKNLLKDKLTAH